MLLISKPQQHLFWREWSKIVSSHGWAPGLAETERKAMLQRIGFTSLTKVDPVNGFTAVLKEMAVLQENLTGMMHADDNPRRMMIWNIRSKSADGYWQSIARDRFGTDNLDSLSDAQLQQILYTVSDRQATHAPDTLQKRAIAQRQRRADPKAEGRVKFPDLPAPATASQVAECECVAGPF